MEKKRIVKRVVKTVAAAAVIGVLCFGGYTAYSFFTRMKNASEVFANVTYYTVGTAEVSDVQEIITTSGVVYLEKERTILSESSEKIKEAFFEEGDYINEGDVVVTYDVSETVKTLERKISDSQIQLENAQLSLKSLALPISESEVSKLRDAYNLAEKSVYDKGVALASTQKDISLKLGEIEKAEKTVEDNKILLDIGAITKDEYEKSVQAAEDLNASLEKLYVTLKSNEMDLASAETSLEGARYNFEHAYDVLTEESEKIKYRQQENSLRSASVSLEQAKEDLAGVIYETASPYSGTVISVTASEGGSVPAGGVLYTVADFSALIVKADVSEYDAPKLAIGQTVNMTSDGIPDTVYTGSISKIAPSATTKSTAGGSESVVAIEISINDPGGALKPGFNLDLDIITVDRKNVLSVTQAALLREPQTKKNYVYTLGGENTAVKTYVTTGLYGDLLVEITEGLTEGQRIVTNPSDQLSEGMFVMTERSGMAGRANAEMQNNAGDAGIFRSLFGARPGGGGNNGNVQIQQGNRSGGANQAVPPGSAAPGDGPGGGVIRSN